MLVHKEIKNEPSAFAFRCPVCSKWIPNSNINGDCPHCKSQGFTTLKIHYGKCHDCPLHFFKDDVLKCNIHVHVPKYFCKDYPEVKEND